MPLFLDVRFKRLLLFQRVIQLLFDPGQRGEVDVVLKPHPRTPCFRLRRASCMRLLPALRHLARSFALVINNGIGCSVRQLEVGY